MVAPDCEKVPVGQLVQPAGVDAPTMVEKLPASQLVQLAEPKLEAYAPAGQLVQVAAAEFEKVPEAQGRQLELEPAPTATEKDPPSHPTHEVELEAPAPLQ